MENGIEKTQLASDGLNQTQIMTGNATQMISGNATQMMPGAEATQMGMMVTCPVCKANTPGGEQYCSDCGFLLSSTPLEVAAVTPAMCAKMIDASDGKEYLLNPGLNTIGRTDADVLLAHPTVSRKHAQITVGDGNCVLEDMGSSNGTYASNTKVEPGSPAEVTNGAELRFGSLTLKLELPQIAEKTQMAEQPVEAPAEASEPTQMPEQETTEVVASAESTETPTEVTAEPSDTPVCEVVEETEEAPAEPKAQVLAKLVAKVGGEEFDVKQGENTLGRRPSNSIMISDPYMSGSHATITAEEGSFVFTDIGSTNGSSINGEKANPNEPKTLSNNDEVTLGQSTFTFVVEEG